MQSYEGLFISVKNIKTTTLKIGLLFNVNYFTDSSSIYLKNSLFFLNW